MSSSIYFVIFTCAAMTVSRVHSFARSFRPNQIYSRNKHVLKESFKNQNSLVHQYWKEAINEQVAATGDRNTTVVAVDCTAGNGHDTLYLAQLLANATNITPKLYFIDINPAAIVRTQELLVNNKQNLFKCIGIAGSHETFPNDIQLDSVDIMCYNLGYMPGNIDDYEDGNRMCTKSSSTVKSINNGLKLLKKGGLMTIIAYRGHEIGKEEKIEVSKTVRRLDPTKWRVSQTKNILVEDSPVVYCVYRRNRTP